MDFNLSDEQEQIRRLARDFAEKEIVPRSAHHDETGEFPRAICEKAWQTGLMNTHIPTEYGGAGLGVLEGCLIAEEIGAACTGIGTAMEANNLAEAPLIVAGNSEQKQEFLAPMSDEFKFAAYCVTEPQAGSDVAGIKTTARKVGNDYVLNGQKMWITNAGVADWYYVLAATDPDQGSRGMSAFIVKRDSEGITVGKKENNMGQRASDTRAITFEDVKVSARNLLGKEGDGFKISMAAFDHTRPLVAAAAVGLARAAMQHAVTYATERQTFGQQIANYQAIGFMLADMDKNVEAARLLAWKAAWLIDQGKRNTREAAIAKAFAADTAMQAAVDAVQVFGGYGYSREYPVEKLMRDAKIFQIYEGTSQIQRVIISRQLVSSVGKAKV
ncbi:MAG TPA: acyl-CoA dehydrogenase family protein [Drouetiella sp.]